MKFLCLKCETMMRYQNTEKPSDDSMGVSFECPSCGARVAMVINPAETQMVHALGVKIGGRTAPPEPFELTRETMKDPAAGIPWTEEAEERLKNVPAFVRPMVRRRIEQMAADEGAERITVEMMEEARQRFEKF